MKHFLATTALLLTALAVAANAQKADEFRQRYGAPDSHGRYIVRPDIGMTVEFAENGRASRMVIKRLDSEEEGTSSHQPKLMSESSAKEILEEVAPAAKRGKLLRTGGFAASCIRMSFDEYEHVTINQTIRCEKQGGGIYNAAVQFK
ncbi:MAG TPA: hypothetical protein VF791_19515 [Pyrinomonadaceae bacterium]